MTTITYNPSRTGLLFHNSNEMVRAVMGPVGSGKSSTCAMELVLRSVMQAPNSRGVRPTRWLAVRNTFNELKTTTLRTLVNWLPPEVSDVRYGYPPVATANFPLADGTTVDTEVMFLALDRPEDTKKLRSLEVTGVWLNEASELQEEILGMAVQRSGRYPAKTQDFAGATWSGVIMDYNPVEEDHWLHELFEIQRPERYRLWKQPPAINKVPNPSYDPTKPATAINSPTLWVGNPDAENIENLKDGFDYYLRQVPAKTEEWIEVFLRGQYGAAQGGRAVYAGEWNDRDHVSETPLTVDKYLPVAVGFDWGLNPSAVFGQLSRTGTLCIIHELFPGVDTSLEEFIEVYLMPAINEHFRGCRMEGFGDPAGIGRSPLDKRTPFQLINAVGIACRPARTNDFIPRRDSVASFLIRRNGFKLSPTCKMLRKGFNREYKYGQVQTTGQYKSRPEKNLWSHPHDALQYLALGLRHSNTFSSNVTVASGGSNGSAF